MIETADGPSAHQHDHQDGSGCSFCTLDQSTLIVQASHTHVQFARGPILPGHVLILPQKHLRDLSDLPPEGLAEIRAAFTGIPAANEAVFSLPTLFFRRHRYHADDLTDQECLHAHFNAVPTSQAATGLRSLIARLRADAYLIENTELLNTARKTVAAQHSHDELIFGTRDEAYVARLEGGSPPNRVFRKLLAEFSGLDAAVAIQWERWQHDFLDSPWVRQLRQTVRATMERNDWRKI